MLQPIKTKKITGAICARYCRILLPAPDIRVQPAYHLLLPVRSLTLNGGQVTEAHKDIYSISQAFRGYVTFHVIFCWQASKGIRFTGERTLQLVICLLYSNADVVNDHPRLESAINVRLPFLYLCSLMGSIQRGKMPYIKSI